MTLGLITEQCDNVPLPCRKALAKPTNELLPLDRDGSFEDIPARTGRYQQCVEKRPLEVCSVMFARHAYRQYLWAHPREMQAHVVDRMSLAHAWAGVHQGAGHQDAKAPFDQIDEGFDRRGRYAIVSP